MKYTLQETLKKLNISKYKFDKLRKYKYINPVECEKWNGMYYIKELEIDEKEIKKLTPKKLDKIFEKIKKEENNNLMMKWKNKIHRHNLRILKNKIEKSSFKYNFENNKSFIDAIDRLNGESLFFGEDIKIEENSHYIVKKIGKHIFDFWKNPLFDNNKLTNHLKPIMDISCGEFLIANVIVDIIEIQNKKDKKDFELFGLISEIKPVDEISQICECCGKLITVPGKVFAHNNLNNICYICYNNLIRLEKGIMYRDNLLKDKDTIILDFETASLDPSDGIVSISIINMNGDVIFDKKIMPDGEVSNEARNCHKLSNDDLINCPSFLDIKDELIKIISNKYIIFAHEFHMDFLESLMMRYGAFDDAEDFCYNESLIDWEIKSCCLNTKHYKKYNSLEDCFDMLKCLR